VAKEAWLVLLVPLLAIFFLKDGRSFSDVALSLVQSRPQKEFLQAVLTDLNQMLAHFIRAQLTLAAFSLVVYVAFLGAIVLPIPRSGNGWWRHGVHSRGWAAGRCISDTERSRADEFQHWLILLIFLAAWRLIQDYVISPRVMGSSMELHPLAAIFGVMAVERLRGARRLPLDSSHGEFADCLAPRKNLRRETALRATERIRIRERDSAQKIVLGDRLGPGGRALGSRLWSESNPSEYPKPQPSLLSYSRADCLLDSHRGIHFHIAQELSRGFRQRRLDGHAGA